MQRQLQKTYLISIEDEVTAPPKQVGIDYNYTSVNITNKLLESLDVNNIKLIKCTYDQRHPSLRDISRVYMGGLNDSIIVLVVTFPNLINYAIGITAVKLMTGCVLYGGRMDRNLDVILHPVF